MRKLASIQRIWKIEPIEGADRIELAHVLGWQCVVNKGQFQEMDLAVYFEVDSFLPIAPEFEFLRVSSYRKTDIMGGTKEMPENVRDSQVPDFVQEEEAQMAKDAQAPKREEVLFESLQPSEQDQGLQAADILIGFPELRNTIIIVPATGRRTGRAVGNEVLLFRMYLIDQSLDSGFIEVYVGNSRKQAFDQQFSITLIAQYWRYIH